MWCDGSRLEKEEEESLEEVRKGRKKEESEHHLKWETKKRRDGVKRKGGSDSGLEWVPVFTLIGCVPFTFASSKSEPLIRQTCNLEREWRERKEKSKKEWELCVCVLSFLSNSDPTLSLSLFQESKSSERGSRSSFYFSLHSLMLYLSLRLIPLDENRKERKERRTYTSKGKREEREREGTWKRDETEDWILVLWNERTTSEVRERERAYTQNLLTHSLALIQ